MSSDTKTREGGALDHSARAVPGRVDQPKWTPGPWTLCDRGDYTDFDGDSRVILGDDDTIRLAVVQTCGDLESEANAHLIAAAPELYEALAAAVACWERLYPLLPISKTFEDAEFTEFLKARAALAKARGEA